MADRRRRSPEGSTRTRVQEPARTAYDEPPRMPNYEQPRMRPGAEPVVYSSSSSSSSSYIDISRTYPRKFGLRAFFTAPSERRRVRRRRSSRLMRNGNSSSSSVNSDLAYGTGFIKRPKRRSVRARNGREIGGDRASDRENHRRPRGERREEVSAGVGAGVGAGAGSGRPPLGRVQTEAEILAIGAGLAQLAREQNRRDLRDARNGSRADLIAGGSTGGPNGQGPSRGLVNSRPSHGSDTVDEEGWESASESEESVDPRLAFGDEGKSSGGFFGLFRRKKGRPLSRKESVVDPRLFGPHNTLHGIVTEPVGFGEVTPWASTNDFGQQYSQGPGTVVSHSGSQASLQRVYPVPTSDPGRFDARAASVISGPEPMVVSRPGPIPIQQPQPIAPISQSVYGRTESGNVPKRESTSSGRGKSLAEAALVGVVGAGVGAAIASASRDDRKRREDDDLNDKNRPRRRGSEKESKYETGREKRRSPDREERREKPREKDDSSRVSSDKRRERRKEETREERDERRERRGKDESRDEKDERREKRRGERRSERFDDRGEVRRTKSETAVPKTVIDPFQFQVADDDFPTPTIEPSQRTTEATPAVNYVTVEREPDFSRIAPIRDARTPDFMHMHRQNPPKYVDSGPGDNEHDARDRALHEAEGIYQETTHFTAPIAVAAVGAAVAAVHHADAERETRSDKRRDERRGERRSDYDDYASKPRDKEPEKAVDPVQEEADRAYREIVMARKIASQVIRSRSNSPNRSVVEKYEEEVEEPVSIATPPGMDDKKKVGPYDAPNADFQLDHVLEDPLDLRNFRITPTDRVLVDAEGPYLKRDPDADRPRPFLNLVRPTPVPSPMPEKQATRSEPAAKSQDREERKQSSTSDVKSKDEAVDSPTSSNVSKGVTWGENETKHFEVESPSEHRDEFVSQSDIKAREAPEEPQPAAKPKSKGWGALKGALMGAGAGAAAAAVAAAAASSNETSKTSKSKEDEEKDAPYEYRGAVVESESPPQSASQRNAPPAGPKPFFSSETSRVPGAFDDDLDFTATVAAGLQDSGFDPNIVIDDPSFRRRESPPGSNDFKPYRAPFAETVSDLGTLPSEISGGRGQQGYILGEVASTPQDWRSVSPPREDDTPTKLSKKEQKKRDKERRRSGDVTPLEESSATRDVVEEPESYFEPPLSKKEQKKRDKLARQNSQGDDFTPSVAEEIVEEPESYFETPKKSKKKSKKGSGEDYVEDTSRYRKVSVPVDAFDDPRNDDDEWVDTKKSKKKSKRDSDRYDSPARSVPSSEIASELERSSSKKSKDKSKRKSEQYEPDPSEVSLPASTPSEMSRDGDFDDSRGTRKSSTRDSGIFNSSDRGDSRSVVSADTSRYDDDEPRKSKKKSRSSTKDDYDDSRSVVSAPAGDDYDDSKRSKKKDKDKEKDKKSGGGFFGLFGSKFDVGARVESPKDSKDDFEESKTKKKSKRSSVADSSSVYGDAGAQSVSELSRSMSNGNGDKNGTYDDPDEENGDDYCEKSKTRSRSESSSSKKDSFLGNAGTLGAGVGIAGAAVAFAAQQYQQPKAANANKRETIEHEQRKSSPSPVLPDEIYDPEITERQFRPSIDPQYGDLLPLPPSNPVSPNTDPIDDLPELPDSRPDTPEPERVTRERSLGPTRKNIQETPMKSPSQSAVPLNFLMRNRSQPSSPRFVRSSPLQSPATPHEDSLSFPRSRPRPTSWDSTKEYKPLYLVESHRRGSSAHFEPEEELPELPPSQQTSRSSSQLDVGALAKDPLSIDTELASSKPAEELLGSEQSTPKAAYMARDDHAIDESFDNTIPMTEPAPRSHPERRRSSPEPKSHFAEHVAEVAAATGLVSTIGYFASSPTHAMTKESFMDRLPSVPRQPSPVDPMTKDRSSYLLQSSPMSKKFEEFEAADLDLDSPSRKQKSSRSSSNAMKSIQEREATDVFGSATTATPEDIEYQREKTMDTLSHYHDNVPDLPNQENTREVLESRAEDLHDQEIIPPTASEAEAADEYTFTKSKKDKDKKKGKGLSRSSTQDDFDIPESSRDFAEEVTGSAKVIPDEEFFVTKSKKDKKKGKGLSRSSTQDEFTIPEPNKDIEEEAMGPAESEPADEALFTTKPKKDKKKDKKKGKAVSDWEPEASDITPQQMEEAVPDVARDVSEELVAPADLEARDEVPTSKSKKEKKKDKRKFVVAWEPEAFESNPQTIEEPEQEPSQSLPEDFTAPIEDEPVDEFVAKTSKKDKKKDKRKSVVTWEPEAFESNPQTIEEPEQEPTRPLPEDITTPIENEPVDEFVAKTSKKAKKKDKKKSVVAWEPDTSENVLQKSEQIEQESTQAVSQDISTPFPDEPVDDFFSTKSKKGKKKDQKKAKSAWEPEEENEFKLSEPTFEPRRDFADETLITAEMEAPDDFAFTKSKKDRKKDKKRSQSNSAVISERVESETPAINTSRDLTEEPASMLHELSALEPPITEPARDLSMIQAPEDLEAITEAELAPEDSSLEPEKVAERDIPAGDEFTFETKKGKKKKGKSMIGWEQEGEAAIPSELLRSESQQDITRGDPEAAQAVDGFFTTKSKKSKKDKKKRGESVTVWEPDEEPASTEMAREVEDTQDFEAAIFKGGKTKKRKSKSFVDEDDMASSSQQEPVENFISHDDSSRSAEVTRGLESQLPAEDSSTTQHMKTMEPENILDVTESLSSKPTPMGGPGAWPITLATPWTSGEVRDTTGKEYFPPAETVHSSTIHEPPAETQSEGYFPSAKTVLPIIAGGAALLGVELFKESSHPNDESTEDGTSSRTVNLDEPSTLSSDPKPTPDGLTAGYDNEQLSLAKRLQEEFSSGSKRSKKDKKRQSLPPTPAREPSRSRTMEEGSELHPRARSLSTGPAAANNYNDDEARQDLAAGTKKSKKDKKKRQGLSRSATQDDIGFDQDVVSSQMATTDFSKDPLDLETSEAVPKGDGFAAGYQEDQLSLARQLQAEFGKKSKKDKKRRSTSQTPQDQEPRDDYFSEQSRAPISDVMEQDQPIPVPEPSVQDTTRDGLAVGYSEEQLELARQLKEEFGSGSKKGKREKKDKKRRSTSQTPLEQGQRDDYFGEPAQVPRFDEREEEREVQLPESNAKASPSRDGLAIGYREEQLELARQLKEEFASGSKKSKKDKKDKKRGSLLRSNTEDGFSSDVQTRDADSGIFEAQNPEFAQQSPANEAEDEFAFATKKSRKDKKDKKRSSLLRSNTEDDISSDAQPRIGASDNFETEQYLVEAGQANEPEDGPTFITKKSKKDKKGKKRASLMPDAQADEFPSDTVSGSAVDEVKSQNIDDVGSTPVEEGPSESTQQEDGPTFTISFEEDRKGKKQDSILEMTAELTWPSEAQLEGQDESRDVVVPNQPDFAPELSAKSVAVGAEDESADSTKKTKKDRKDKKGKKRDSTVPSATDEEIPSSDFGQEVEALHAARDMKFEDIAQKPAVPEDDWSVPVKISKKDKKRQSGIVQEQTYGQRKVETSSTQPEEDLAIPKSKSEAVDEASDDFGFSSKRSKKDKKKRGSLLRSSTFDETPEEKAIDFQPEYESREAVDEATATIASLANDQEDGFGFSSKKSKKDKKKRGSLLQSSTFEGTPEEQSMETETTSEGWNVDDNATITPPANEQEARFEYSSKKSKKDKKKRGSLLRNSTFGETLQEPIIENEVHPGPDSRDLGDDVVASLPSLAEDQDDGFEYSSKKSENDEKERKSSLQTPMPEDLPKEIEEPQKEEDESQGNFAEDLQPSKFDSEYRAPEPAATFDEGELFDEPSKFDSEYRAPEPATAFDERELFEEPSKFDNEYRAPELAMTFDEGKLFEEPSNINAELEAPESTAREAAFEQDTAINQPEEASASGPSDIFHDFAFTRKKSKKDKKKRKDSMKDDSEEISGFSTPSDPMAKLKSIVESSMHTEQDEIVKDDNPGPETLAHSASGQQDEEPADEWSSFSVKKSKKDKKRKKSARTASVDPSDTLLEPEIATEERHLPINDSVDLDKPEAPLSQSNEDSIFQATAEDNIKEPTKEWASFSNKNSKKDKKKSKSLSRSQSDGPSENTTLSSPTAEAETIIREASLPTESISREAVPSDSIREPEDLTGEITKRDIEEPVDERASSTAKKSKKHKKRKSGLSTPAEATEEFSTFATADSFAEDSPRPSLEPTLAEHDVPTVEAEGPMPEGLDDEVLSSKPHAQDIRDLGLSNEEYTEPGATDEAFAFVTKRSKKEKRSSKRSTRAISESRATTSGLANPLPIELNEPESALLTEQTVSSPVAMESENLDRADHGEQYSEQPAGDDERTDSFSFSRTPSKKDKRKRQAIVADISLDGNMHAPTKPPLTSWADEVEEAGIERELPVIQDIANDESLSHIASTTDSAPADDFFRPTKKGKKGKKGKKRVSEAPSSVESSRPATSSGLPKDNLADEHSDMGILAATGAALVGAALLSEGNESQESSSKIASAATPQRKLSKKEKKKKSIDLGPTPRDDIFDDPALWEGAEPKAHEEIRHIDDDAGSDGFGFTSRDTDEPVPFHEPYEIREPSPGLEHHRHVEDSRPISPACAARSTPEEAIRTHERELSLEDAHTPREDLPGDGYQLMEEHKSREPEHGSSTGEERIGQTPSDGYVPENAKDSEDIHLSEEHFSGPSRSIVDTPPADNEVSFEEPLPIIHEDISTPSKTSGEQAHGERSVAFENVIEHNPTRPLSTGKYGRSSFSDLPVVHEELEHLPPHPYHDFEGNRDSAFVTGSPTPRHQFTDDHEHVRDSGVHLRDLSPAENTRPRGSSTDDALAGLSWPQVDEETETVDLHRSQRPVAEASTGHHHQEKDISETHYSHSPEPRRPRGDKTTDFYQSQRSAEEELTHHAKAPLTSRDLFPSFKSTEEISVKHHDHGDGTSRDHLPSQHSTEERHTDLHRVATIHGSHGGRMPREDSIVKQRLQRFESPDFQRPVKPREDKYAELGTSPRPRAERPKGVSEVEAGAAIAGASLGFAAARKFSQEQRPPSAQSQRSSSNINRLRTPDPKRPDSGASNRSGTPPLRRSDRKLSGDLRSLSQRSKPDLAKEAELAALASATSAALEHAANPTANEGRVRAKDMATDVYDGFGEGRMGSPRSPTRPHSMRRRQSMQVLDLESKVEQLVAENRMLAEAKAQAERTLASTSHASSSLIEDAEIDSLKRTLDWLQNEVTRLTQVNEGLNSSHVELGRQHNERYGALESQHAQATRELQEVRDAHDNLSACMEGIVRNEVQSAVQDKDREIAQLRAELDAAKEQIREMQRQILASKADEVDFLTIRDEDYFDNACQSLCQHVQQWVLRFSKFSDMRACRLSSEINNDKTIDRLDNAILDGSDVDSYLADRIKRRDVFMSMTMNMVWEFIFTRYLFGMDREQRQKLKSLEKTLSEVGPAAAVHHWRATTLTLLSKRDAFIQQREQDTQAVVHAIIETLSEILPPPSNLETQIEEQLTRVMKEAVDLSIEMRTQRAEYMMLPPLLPEYDANGDLASKVSFNAALMNERSGDTVSNEELEQQKAVVRVVLFPLVVKKGDDRGEGDEEIVVCPAQVLVAKPKKSVRVLSGSVQGHSRISLQSSMPADYGEGSVI